MSFEYLHLQLVRIGAKSLVPSQGKLYFTFNDLHWKVENTPGKTLLQQYTPQHNLPNVVNQNFELTQGDWREIITTLKAQPEPVAKPEHTHKAHPPKNK